MHNGYINVNNKKMSKSLHNFFTVRDVAEKYGYEPIRFLMISAHYRTPINYSVDVIEQCRSSLERLYNCRENLEFLRGHVPSGEKPGEREIRRRLEGYQDRFIEFMEDDLNTADALSALFDLARDINRNLTAAAAPSKELCTFALDLFNELAGVLGLLYGKSRDSADEEIERLISERAKARKEKNWAEADRIRDELKARHVVVEDTPQGAKWKIVE
jgi:cysteinyl-tRNA synthetase